MTESPLEQTSGGPSAARLLQEVLLFNDALQHSLCRQLDINETDFKALQHLTFGTALTPGELAAKLGITSAASTALVDRLSARGQVVRTPNPSDRRSVLVHASPDTVELVVTALRPLFKDPNDRLNNTAPEEHQAVIAFLEDILHSIHAGIDSFPATTAAKRRARS
ncbi:DNA-binding MarR family transcriptional regulator [Arthrobacter stackebrandtii]|uniref:DNA-binding MarR family transcriptional regulator n=1 Tax=Arthrobacter stackebrandtii TaxID=272161 RepID=A0ABS4YZQ8_9MICC|nr:MarR family transcriptional regulator [Arthrobacter stackebrandtii]MBP2414214.1 DNA-binding MarR family transcriptional regulator [Arthrobacter stackebrandtii]PYG98923.1 hypothetical protein CVV67_17775 [Arthrobacter stackebrandtii]